MKVLLVDDEVIVVNALKRRVAWEKYGVDEVFTANSMKQAVDIFGKAKIDFMLCDVEMPQGSGLELYEWVREHYPLVPCIYITCHPDFEYIRKALRLGSEDYLLKPVDYEELDEILTVLTSRLRKQGTARLIPEGIILKISQEESSQNKAIRTIERYILEHIQENICIEVLADEVYLNKQYLMRLFKKEVGCSIVEYISRQRILLAKELLTETDFPISKVADAVGYGNYSYFSKIFKRETGFTPQSWRQDKRRS